MNGTPLTAKDKVLQVLAERGTLSLGELALAIPDTKAETIRRIVGQELIPELLVSRPKIGIYQLTAKGQQLVHAGPQRQQLLGSRVVAPRAAPLRDVTNNKPYALTIRGPTNHEARVSKRFVQEIMAKLMDEEDE